MNQSLKKLSKNPVKLGRSNELCVEEEEEVKTEKKSQPKASGKKSKAKKKESEVCGWCKKKEADCKCPDVCPGCNVKKGGECTCDPNGPCPKCKIPWKDCPCFKD